MKIGDEIVCFGEYCPDTWEIIQKPIILGDKIISPHTLFAYEAYSGIPKLSGTLEYLPMYRVVEKNGEIILAETCNFEKSRFPKVKTQDKYDFITMYAHGDTLGSLSWAL